MLFLFFLFCFSLSLSLRTCLVANDKHAGICLSLGLLLGNIFNYIATHVRRTTSCVFLFITCRIDMLEYRQFQWCYGDNGWTTVSTYKYISHLHIQFIPLSFIQSLRFTRNSFSSLYVLLCMEYVRCTGASGKQKVK